MTQETPPALEIALSRRIPDGDDHDRLICDHCGLIQYVNPKIVVGSVVYHEDRILLCKRAIEPRLGYWTMPAGYMELQESTEMAARREAQEEACAEIDINALLAIYSITRISQVQIIYRARLANPAIAAGPESQEVRLFHWDEIPWQNLAFPTVLWALRHFKEAPRDTVFPPFGNPAD